MLIIGEHPLTIDEIVQVARKNEIVTIGENARMAIMASRERLLKLVESDNPVYGINTGFGIFADKKIKIEESNKLSRNLILSHAVGIGENLPSDVTRAAMLIRANTLAKGYSGVRLELIQTLLDMLNKHVTPMIPSQGSLGSSGDLCQLSHMALVMSTDEADKDDESGFAAIDGVITIGKVAMEKAGIRRLILGPKEGLALNNGATFSAALGALNVYDSGYFANMADNIVSLTLEALQGASAAFDERIHEARGQIGQMESAKRIIANISGSTFVDSSPKIQDAYSLRCAPQVHGAVRDTITFAKQIIEREVNAATDNPLIFDPCVVISGGNFHGEPVGMVMDYLGIALSELGAISERRIFRMLDGKLNAGLPPMLVDSVDQAGLNSGLMMPQYTAVSLVLENQTLATPDTVHSLPTSAEQEDHNANSMTAARHAAMIIKNVTHILGIELYTAVRAIELRMRMQPGQLADKNQELFTKIRGKIPYSSGDKLWGPEINQVTELITNHSL